MQPLVSKIGSQTHCTCQTSSDMGFAFGTQALLIHVRRHAQLRVESSKCVSFFIHVPVGLCTACHDLESIRTASISELLLGAPLPLRVEISSNHKRRATCGLIATECNKADDSRCVLHTHIHLYRHMLRHCYGLRLMETVRILRNEAPVFSLRLAPY